MDFYQTLAQAGHVIFGRYFFYGGLKHVLLKSKDYIAYSKMKGVPSPALAVYVSGVLLLLGGAGIVTQMYVTPALWCLVVFLVPVTYMMHAFWKAADPMMKMGESVQFGKNLALLGAVLSMMY